MKFYIDRKKRNLVEESYSKDDKKLEEAMSKAQSFLTKKKLTKMAEYYVRFFVLLAE